MLKTLNKITIYLTLAMIIICLFDCKQFILNIINNLCKFNNITERFPIEDYLIIIIIVIIVIICYKWINYI